MLNSTILYFAALIVAIASIIISLSVKGRFNQWSKRPNARGITGKEVAERMLRNAGVHDVSVQPVRGVLTDHYDPRNKTVNLSEEVYGAASIASVAVAAHECGHSIQHHEGYTPVILRHKFVPIANFGSKAAIWLFAIGMIIAYLGAGYAAMWLIDLAIIGYVMVLAFHVITLPVEFNASKRALVTLRESNILAEEEMGGARKVLAAAAMTYVAAAAAAAIQLLRMIAIRNRD